MAADGHKVSRIFRRPADISSFVSSVISVSLSPLGALSYPSWRISYHDLERIVTGAAERRPFDESHPQKRCPGILATSRQSYHEVRRELYSNRMITFHISPNPKRASAKRSGEHPRTDVLDPLGSLWCLRPRYHKPRKAEDQNMLSWEQLPYRKLKGVNFELLATDPANPAELLQVWNELRNGKQIEVKLPFEQKYKIKSMPSSQRYRSTPFQTNSPITRPVRKKTWTA
ncbi:hypothetical protein EPUS_07534 [Endocarpon pusillum Z07020]|uniref:Uncharacterized protein n=1 Tax=Endocarpon pusillum (strain Z07020 / HMAS-L-300199) TaxID=1263415 RepID=U1G4W6_ENDPU|nr:uncharacterized protein EPUS_07534 [Endocarpon pusillum Z07020]ERF72372.1 hypothetical protein EPUS_07534 [Endocarpon pusillum Z07020]